MANSSRSLIKISSRQFKTLHSYVGKGILPASYRAGVVADRQGKAKWFLFDTEALWEFLCRIDARYEEEASDEAYLMRNPVGALIDTIEGQWPHDETAKRALKGEFERAQKEVKAGRVNSLEDLRRIFIA